MYNQLLTDLNVYDWWALILGFAGHAASAAAVDEDNEEAKERIKWVGELMVEEEGGVRALPRSMEMLGRCYDSREFWETLDIMPIRSRV